MTNRDKTPQMIEDLMNARGERALIPIARGRPIIEINKNQLEIMAKYGAKQRECAKFFGCSEAKISLFIKAEYQLDFESFSEQQKIGVKYDLIYKVMNIINKELDASSGRINNNLVMFALKNLAGWKEKIETTGNQHITGNGSAPTVVFAFSDDTPTEAHAPSENIEMDNFVDDKNTIDI